MYLIKTRLWMRTLYPSLVWRIPTHEKLLFLTFDDGPNERATPFVLDTLKKFDAKATFFCIGKNVMQYPEIYKRILDEGHTIGNHTHSHLNGWTTDDAAYIANVFEAARHIKSDLFRPPYGKITGFQAKILQGKQGKMSSNNVFKVIMWDVLSGDFDLSLSPEKCLQNILEYTEKGSIIVLHDSDKAWDRMSYTLPRILKYFHGEGYQFCALE